MKGKFILKKILICVAGFIIISQLFAYLFAFVGFVCCSFNSNISIVSLNLSNVLTISKRLKAYNYSNLGVAHLVGHNGRKSIEVRRTAAKYFGSCSDYDKNSHIYSSCKGNMIFLGLLYYANGDFQKSVHAYESVEAYGAMVAPYILMRDYNNALKYAKKSLEKNQTCTEYFNLAIVYRFLGEDRIADLYFKKLLILAKENGETSSQINKYIDKYNNYQMYYAEQQKRVHDLNF